MLRLRRLVLVIPLTAGFLFASTTTAETWTDVTGKYRIEATYLKVDEGKVHLQKADGSTIAVPIKQLSPESIELAKRKYEASQSNGASPASASERMPTDSSSTRESKLGDNPSARETAEILSAAAAEFDMVTIWDAFPDKHQKDVEEVVRLAANSLDEQTWNGVASLLQKASELVTEKKEFFLGNQMIGGVVPNTPENNELWDAVAKMMTAVTSSSLTDQSAMQNFTMNQFLVNDVPKIKTSFEKVQTLTEKLQDKGSPFGRIAETPTIETVSESTTDAVFKITSGGQTQEQRLVKFENRWVPAEMVEGWDEAVEKAKTQLAALDSPEARQNMTQMRMGLMMANAPLDQLLSANSQEEFDKTINDLVGMVMGMMGDMQGGPGIAPVGPPPGFGDDPPPAGF